MSNLMSDRNIALNMIVRWTRYVEKRPAIRDGTP
jgi:hypothetical protein